MFNIFSNTSNINFIPQYLIKEECCGNCEKCSNKHNKKKRIIPYVPESERSKLSEGVDGNKSN